MKLKTTALLTSYAITTGAFAAHPTLSAKADLIAADSGKKVGTVTLSESKGKVQISGNVSGLTKGKHGIHVHQNGDCSDYKSGFMKSGGHFNADGTSHGNMTHGHAGDLGNLKIYGNKGPQYFCMTVPSSKFNIEAKDSHSILGRALVIHAGQDDEKTNPAGNSGARKICGVIVGNTK